MTPPAAEPITVKPVRSARALTLFIEIAYRLRMKDPNWVPPLRRDMRTLLDRTRHPFHEHAAVDYFLAFRGRRCVGRIAAIENFAHNAAHGEKVGFFGFLDAEPDADVFAALLRAAERWAAARGLTHLRGPCSFSTNEECGMLVEGFDAPPPLMTPWNPPSYPRLAEACGYAKAMDLFSYWIDEGTYSERVAALAERIKEKQKRRGEKITIRSLRIDRFAEELENIRTVYNGAWEKNWGFVPMTRAEIDFMAKELKPLLMPELVRFLEVDGKPVGFTLMLPDYNVILRHMRGNAGPLEILLFLLMKPRLRQMRLLTMGVMEEHRRRGFETLMLADLSITCRATSMHAGELGWVLETNQLMNRGIEAMGGRRYRVHRIYEKAL